MSTRARIGVEAGDGSIKSLYLHHDGYRSHVGPILLEHYCTRDDVSALMALGDLSILGASLGQPQSFAAPLVKGWCRAYGRDRGDVIWAAQHATAVDGFERSARDCNAEYVYLYRHGTWWCSKVLLPAQAGFSWQPLQSSIDGQE